MKPLIPLFKKAGLAAGLILGLVACPKKDTKPEQASVAKNRRKANQPQVHPLKAYFKRRNDFDQQVWQAEIEAQEYEQSIVGLWDALRTASDKFSVLASISFETLDFVKLDQIAQLGNGIKGLTLIPSGQTFDQNAWRQQLNKWKRKSYSLIQSEWHQRRFYPQDGKKKARSIFTFEWHVQRKKPFERLLIKGELELTWKTKNDGSKPRAAAIKILSAEILQSTKPAAFIEVGHIDLGADKPKMVLAADLSGDARSEIAILSTNKLYLPAKLGQYTVRKLVSHRRYDTSSGILADFNGDGLIDLLLDAKLPIDEITRRGLLLYPGSKHEQIDEKTAWFSATPIPVFLPDKGHELERARAFAVGDIDQDGDLDLWLTQYRGAYSKGEMPYPFYNALNGWPSFLLRNTGKGVFEDVTQDSGLAGKRRRHTQSASFVDLDGDRDLDLITVSDFAGIDTFINDGRGQFTDVSKSMLKQRTMFGMALAVADFDQDGREDLFVTGMNSTTVDRLNAMNLQRKDHASHTEWRTKMTYGNRLLIRNKSGQFAQADVSDSVARSGWAWGTVAFDPNNDGAMDLFVANGFKSGKSARDYCTKYWTQDVYFDNSMDKLNGSVVLERLLDEVHSGKISWNGFEHNRFFMNQGRAGFREIAFLLGLGSEADGRNVLVDDIDLDGRQDLLIAEVTENQQLHLRIMHNRWTNPGNWIGVRVAPRPKRSPWGAKIIVHSGTKKKTASLLTGDSFMVQHPSARHFGLGKSSSVDAIEVIWPDGHRIRKEKPKLGMYHDL